jgi:amidase
MSNVLESTQPCDLSAVTARDMIAARALSPVELLESCIARISAVNPAVNAIVALDLDRARAAAKAAEDAVMRNAELPLLHGLPIGIKDLEETAGLRTTHGSLLFRDHVPAADDLSVAHVRAAGGIVLAKTNTPEFGAGANTVNRVYGATGNPFAPELSCGGSSGGSAVALATGMVSLASGSDMGGSLRTPAAWCGVVGFRPSAGLVPDVTSTVALSPFPVIGPMGRTVADAHLLLRAQMGFDHRDPFVSAVPAAVPALLKPADLGTVRVIATTDLGCAPMDAGIRAAFEHKVARFAPQLGQLDWHDPNMTGIHEAFEVLRAIGFVASFADAVRTRRNDLGINVIDNTERGLRYSMADVANAFAVQTRIFRDYNALFDQTDVIIAPATALSPFPHGLRAPTHVNGEAMPTYMRWLAIVYGFTMALACVACIPCGRDANGLPFGIQIAGRRGDDARVLAVALALEAYFAGDPELARAVPVAARLTMSQS